VLIKLLKVHEPFWFKKRSLFTKKGPFVNSPMGEGDGPFGTEKGPSAQGELKEKSWGGEISEFLAYYPSSPDDMRKGPGEDETLGKIGKIGPETISSAANISGEALQKNHKSVPSPFFDETCLGSFIKKGEI